MRHCTLHTLHTDVVTIEGGSFEKKHWCWIILDPLKVSWSIAAQELSMHMSWEIVHFVVHDQA